MNTDWLSFLRSATGAVLGCMLIAYWNDFVLLHHPRLGVADFELLHLLAEGPMPSVGQLAAAFHRYSGLDASVFLMGIAATYITSCALLIIGWKPRWVAAALLLQHHAIYIAMPAFSYGADYLAMSALACCCVAPRDHQHPGRRATRQFLQVLLCFVYFMGGYDKLGASWLSGEALWKALHLPGYSGWAYSVVAVLPSWPGFWALAGTAVVCLELLYPLCVWLKPTRKIVLVGIVSMHIAIASVLGLYYFSALMIVLNVAAFIAPDTEELHPATRPILSSSHGGHLHPPALKGLPKPPSPPIS